MEGWYVLLLGFLLGMRHATDADHLVAVTTIVSSQRRLSAAGAIGAVWGLGHTLTILLIGSAIIYLDVVITPRLGLFMEFCVGVMIVLLGFISLKRFMRNLPAAGDKALARPFLVGLVHGMAGSAAVALLVVKMISDTTLAALYLLVFGLGTVAGMMAATLVIGLPYLFAEKWRHIHRYLGLATASFSILFGLQMMYELGIQDGLFFGDPQWTPE